MNIKLHLIMKQKEGELVKQYYILWRTYFDWGYPVRDHYTIWQFTLPTWHGVKAALEGQLQLTLFFYVLAVAISNWIHTLKQIKFVLTIPQLSAISWPQTNWITPSKNMLHMCWTAKELVMFVAWNYLLYGLVWGKPELLYRWELLSESVLLADILFLTRARWGYGFAILTCYLVPLWNIYCVNSVRISTEQFTYPTTIQALNRTQDFFDFEIFEHLLYSVHT